VPSADLNSELEVCVFDRNLRRLRLRAIAPLALAGLGTAAALGTLPAVATAAAPMLVTPASLTQCSGSLKPGGKPSVAKATTLDYSFTCSTDITAFTVFVVRPQDQGNNIQQFATGPNVVFPANDPTPGQAGTTTTQGVTCEGVTPSDGVNCYAQAVGSDGKTPVLGAITAFFTTEASITLDEPYCKFLPKGAKPGTAAVPRAIVEYTVTDSTGAEDGPFVLNLKGSKCPTVPNAAPAKTAAKQATKTKANRIAPRNQRGRRVPARG
jgi:hypothetical protein